MRIQRTILAFVLWPFIGVSFATAYALTNTSDVGQLATKCAEDLKSKFFTSFPATLSDCEYASSCRGASPSKCGVYSGVAVFYNYKGASSGGDYIVNKNPNTRLSPHASIIKCKKIDGRYYQPTLPMQLRCKNIINKKDTQINNCNGKVTVGNCP